MKIMFISMAVGLTILLAGLGLGFLFRELWIYNESLGKAIAVGIMFLLCAPWVGHMILDLTPLGYWVKKKFIWKD